MRPARRRRQSNMPCAMLAHALPFVLRAMTASEIVPKLPPGQSVGAGLGPRHALICGTINLRMGRWCETGAAPRPPPPPRSATGVVPRNSSRCRGRRPATLRPPPQHRFPGSSPSITPVSPAAAITRSGSCGSIAMEATPCPSAPPDSNAPRRPSRYTADAPVVAPQHKPCPAATVPVPPPRSR